MGRKFNLCGRDEKEQALVEMLLGQTDEMLERFVALSSEKNRVQQIQLVHKFTAEFLPMRLKFFERTLSNNATGFLVGKYLTVADLFLVTAIDSIMSSEHFTQDALLYYSPNIVNHRQRIKYIPGIAQWNQTHN